MGGEDVKRYTQREKERLKVKGDFQVSNVRF